MFNSIARFLLFFLFYMGMVSHSYAKHSTEIKLEGSLIPDDIVTFKKIANTELKLHIFKPPNYQSHDKHPVIVLFFGGGWIGGKPSQLYPQSAYLAAMGMVAISAEYRVEKRHSTTPRESVADAISAIAWVREHANELGIDPNKIAAGGASAGGHLAAAAATVGSLNTSFSGIKDAKPNALVLFSPVIDNSPEGYGYKRVKDYWREISPIHNLDKKTPPTIFFLGAEDELIPVSTGQRYKAIMENNGVRCDLHIYKDQAHGFFNYFNRPYFYETMKETAQFLSSLGYIK